MQAPTQRVPRGDSKKAAASTDGAVLHPLPADVLAQIFLLVPVPDRLRCREVCRALRAFLSDPKLWHVLHLSRATAPATLRLWRGNALGTTKLHSLLLAANAAARGGLEVLDVADAPIGDIDIRLARQVEPLRELLAGIMALNAGSLRVARLVSGAHWELDASELEELLGAAPLPSLAELSVDAKAVGPLGIQRWADLLSSPRGRAVSVRSMQVDAQTPMEAAMGFGVLAGPAEAVAPALRALARVLSSGSEGAPQHRGSAPRPHGMGTLAIAGPFPLSDAAADLAAAVVDAAVETRAGSFSLLANRHIGPAFLPHLSRLLREGAPWLRRLEIHGSDLVPSFAPPGGGAGGAAHLADLCAALRASRLTSLSLRQARMWRLPGPSFAAVVGALRDHPTLSEIEISDDNIRPRGAADGDGLERAHAIASLIAVNSPVLRSLTIGLQDNDTGFSFAGLEAFFGALRGNAHLETLGLGDVDPRARVPGREKDLFPAGEGWLRFFREHALPAVRACGSLREVRWLAAANGAFPGVQLLLWGRSTDDDDDFDFIDPGRRGALDDDDW